MNSARLIWITPDSEKIIGYCARVSNPANQDNEEIGALLKYCLDHEHWSIFEMANMCVEIETSRAISAQIIRHRSFSFQEFCVSGDTEITLKLPSGATYKRPISALYKLQSHPNQHIKQTGLPLARILDQNNLFATARIREVFYTGKKPIFRVELSDGKVIKCTKEHKFYTKNGYESLESIVGLEVIGDTAIMTKRSLVATNGIELYKSPDWLLSAKTTAIRNRTGLSGIAEQAGVTTHTIRKWLKHYNLQFTKKEVRQYNEIWNKNKFGYSTGKRTLETIEKMRKSAKRGSDSNLWRGGVDRSERLRIADWCNSIRTEKLLEYNYKCKNCIGSNRLELDHIIPVYENIDLAYSYDNIQVLCHNCHQIKHNLVNDPKIWREKHTGNTLTVKWVEISKITYIGIEDTYDLEIVNNTHNYVANGIVVHNSQRYAPVPKIGFMNARRQDLKNRQNSVDDFSNDLKDWWTEQQLLVHNLALEVYSEALKAGVAKEVARAVLPMSSVTRMYMNGNIRSWLTYLKVRLGPETQLEHREVARSVQQIFIKELPIISEVMGWKE